jgi:hypothetical protein
VDKTTCLTCGFVIAVDREGAHMVMTFDIAEWQALCISQGGGDPALCLVMEPKIRALLLEASGEPNGRNGQQ